VASAGCELQFSGEVASAGCELQFSGEVASAECELQFSGEVASAECELQFSGEVAPAESGITARIIRSEIFDEEWIQCVSCGGWEHENCADTEANML
jgi:hypothetical protein